jgi:hypothetical protein
MLRLMKYTLRFRTPEFADLFYVTVTYDAMPNIPSVGEQVDVHNGLNGIGGVVTARSIFRYKENEVEITFLLDADCRKANPWPGV